MLMASSLSQGGQEGLMFMVELVPSFEWTAPLWMSPVS